MIYLIVTIDTECDKGTKWKVKQPLQFTNIYEGLNNLLLPVFTEFEVQPTYLLSPEVLLDSKSMTFFNSLQNAELGAHLHSEFIEPYSNYNTLHTSRFQFELTYETEYQKLSNLTQLFTRSTGKKPVSFRAGRFGISKNTLRILESLDYKIDCSVTPFLWWMNKDKQGVNFLGAPVQPYFPDRDNISQEGNSKILEVPVTIINRQMMKLPGSLLRNLNPLKKHQRILLSLTNSIKNNTWLRPTYSSADQMIRLVKFCNQYFINQDIFLCMMFHSNEYQLNTSPYSLTRESLNTLSDRLRLFLEFTAKSGIKSIRLSSVADLIKR